MRNTTKQAIIDYLTGKSLLILGYGREGKSALQFIQQNLPTATVAVADQATIDLPGVRTISGPDYLQAVNDYDLVIKSPGVVIEDALSTEQKQKLTSITDLFLRFCPNSIIGITGTKGKSTTASLTYHILKTCGKNALLVGNIGKPCFDVLDEIAPDSIIVFELSCHQLEFVQASPHIAILLNLYEEHLDHYINAEAYYTAKKNIYAHQTAADFLIYGDIFQHASRSEIDYLPMHKVDLYHDMHIEPQEVHTSLLGEHNMYDIFAATAACEAVGLDRQDILAAVASFHGLPHRLEFIGNYHQINFYNDSIATAQEATINGIKALSNVDTVILGGMDRGLDYHPLVDFLRSSTVRNVLLLPNTEQSFQRIFNEAPFSQNLRFAKDLDEAVKLSYQLTAEGHSCLLSPAAASYGFYKNFEARGDHFRQLVQKYAK